MKDFKDFNFKLMVVQELMYNQEVLEPAFDVNEFAAEHTARKIDLDKISYDVIPEVKAHFLELEVPDELLDLIEELNVDGGDEIYLQLCPHWDGEDDLFNVKSAADCASLKNLKKVTLFYDKDDSILEQFRRKGVEASWI